jgi:hypothetical protein
MNNLPINDLSLPKNHQSTNKSSPNLLLTSMMANNNNSIGAQQPQQRTVQIKICICLTK